MMLDFLSRLENNLSKSINTFKEINKNPKIADLNVLSNLIQSNSQKLNSYLELLKELKNTHVSETINEQDNYKEMFKNNIKADINNHKQKNKKVETKTLTSIENVDIAPSAINIQIIKNIKDIPPMFYWYEGDKIYKKGIYVCMSAGFYIRVPFPNIISINNQNFKMNSLPCKYVTKTTCAEIKKKSAQLYNSDVRDCSFLHANEKFIKIGTAHRCNIESFGNHESLNDDMNFITINDIKRIMMHSLSDSLLSVLWYQNKFKNGDLILTNIELFNK
jgi:hypothetical protein